jgi:hypothetical protein
LSEFLTFCAFIASMAILAGVYEIACRRGDKKILQRNPWLR